MSEDSLGTLEFCSVLNGDDAEAAYQYLKRFVKTCQRQRREALSETDGTVSDNDDTADQDDDSMDESENASESRPAKKSKTDAWKLDTKGYAVPFVGTSTHKGPTGTIKKGAWPCGFLQAYLEKSPRAVELLNNPAFIPPSGRFHRDFLRRKDKKGKQKSIRLHNVYVQAIGEIATCSIPRRRWRDVYPISDCNLADDVDSKLTSIIVKDSLSHLLMILNNESSSGASQPILESVLRTMKYLVSCSVSIARDIVGAIDAKLKDGITQRLAIYGTRINKMKDENICLRQMIQSFKVQNAFLELATVLISFNDATILSYVTNPGGRDSKIKPGIAYLAFRASFSFGIRLSEETTLSDGAKLDGLESLAHFFSAIHTYVLAPISNQKGVFVTRRLISNGTLLDFFQGDSLEKIIRMSVIADQNKYLHLKQECDAIISTAISDPLNSPFLVQLNLDKEAGRVPNTAVLTQLDRAIQYYLSVHGDMISRRYVARCFNQTPSLFLSWMKTQQLPEAKPSFSFLSKCSLISFMLENGPIDYEVVHDDLEIFSNNIISNVIPKAVTKLVLTKALQSQNKMLVSEALKLIIDLFKRYERQLDHLNWNGILDCEIFAQKLSRKLPDIQLIFAVRTRFYLIEEIFDELNSFQISSNQMVMFHLCQTIQLYSKFLPRIVQNFQYDWVKFIPRIDTFLQSHPSLQYCTLKTFSCVLECTKLSCSNTMTSSRFFGIIAQLLLRTYDESIYNVARTLLENVLFGILYPNTGKSCCASIRHEISIWVDSIRINTVDSYCKLLEASQNTFIQHNIISQSAWRYSFPIESVPEYMCPPLLTSALLTMISDVEMNPELQNDLSIAAAKYLMVVPDPRLVAALITYILKEAASPCLKDLRFLAEVFLLKCDLHQLVISCNRIFGESHCHSLICKILCKDFCNAQSILDKLKSVIANEPCHNSMNFLRQCLNLGMHWSSNNTLHDAVTIILPFALQEIGEIEVLQTELLRPEASKQLTSFLPMIYSCISTVTSNKPVMSLSIPYSELVPYESGIEIRKMYLIESSITHFVPSLISSKCIEYLVKTEKNHEANSFIVLALLCQALKSIEVGSIPQVFLENLCSLWVRLHTEVLQNHLKTAKIAVQEMIEQVLSSSVNNHEMSSFDQLSMIHIILQLPPHFFINPRNIPPNGIIFALFKNDIAILGKWIEDDLLKHNYSSPDYNNLITIASTIISKISDQQLVNLRHLTWYNRLSDFIVDAISKAAQLLFNGEKCDYQKITFMIKSVIIAWDSLLISVDDRIIFCKTLTLFLQYFVTSKRHDVRKPLESACLEVISMIYQDSNFREDYVSLEQLGNSTSVYIMKMLPKIVKERELNVFDQLSQIVMTLIDRNHFPKDSLLQLLVVCLKLGISDNDDPIHVACLTIARKLIIMSSEDKIHRHDEFVPPHKVHEMVLSHSKFDIVMHQESCLRMHLISLLITCMSLSTQNTSLPGSEKMRSLLSTYRASVSDSDRLLRRLIHLYEQKRETKSLMQDLRWGSLSNAIEIEDIYGTDHCHQYEWFLECLDIHRVRKTISNFPIYDTLIPLPFPSIELRVNERPAMERIQQICQNVEVPDMELSDASISDSDAIDRDASPIDKKHDTVDLDNWRALDSDDRYSPGATLPYILAVLETFHGTEASELKFENDSDFKKNNSVEEISPEMETFVKVSHRLFHKGAISLAISGLGSKCIGIRKVSLAIISKFQKSLQIKGSQSNVSWKSRSQVEMAINSLQRGLLLTNAMKMRDQDVSERSFMVPILPMVSALFVARSLILLTKPGDDLYPAINKHFLRLDDHYGAYKDCFSLPIFMSLFCSVNEHGEGIARKERLFALQLLKDGTVDELCYRVASKRHVPELLLSAFSSYLMQRSFTDESECLLILETIETLVKNGGHTSYRHYFKSVGIIPWFQSGIQTFIVQEKLQSYHLMISFLNTFHYMLQKYHTFLIEEEADTASLLTLDSSNLLRALGELNNIVESSKTKFLNEKSELLEDIYLKIFCDVHDMEAIRWSKSTKMQIKPIIESYGFPIPTALRLFHKADSNISLKIIVVLCSFPLNLDVSDSKQQKNMVILYIEFLKALSQFLLNQVDAVDACNLLFKNISVLSSDVRLTDSSRIDVIEELLRFRSIAVMEDRIKDSWMNCLQNLGSALEKGSQPSKMFIRCMSMLIKLDEMTGVAKKL